MRNFVRSFCQFLSYVFTNSFRDSFNDSSNDFYAIFERSSSILRKKIMEEFLKQFQQKALKESHDIFLMDFLDSVDPSEISLKEFLKEF